jgi:membrane-associated PAP2 superfamily phosphatase
VLPLTLLTPKGERANYFGWARFLIWGIAVAVSRVVIGAHFASHMLFATGVLYIWFFILRYFIMKDPGLQILGECFFCVFDSWW